MGFMLFRFFVEFFWHSKFTLLLVGFALNIRLICNFIFKFHFFGRPVWSSRTCYLSFILYNFCLGINIFHNFWNFHCYYFSLCWIWMVLLKFILNIEISIHIVNNKFGGDFGVFFLILIMYLCMIWIMSEFIWAVAFTSTKQMLACRILFELLSSSMREQEQKLIVQLFQKTQVFNVWCIMLLRP